MVAPPPSRAPAAKVTEYPLSCNAAAKAATFKAWDAYANSQHDMARDGLKQAVSADPKCVMARATLAGLTPGTEGRMMFDEAKAQTSGLTELEKLDLAGLSATRDGDPEKAFSFAQRMVATAPSVVHTYVTAARYALTLEKWSEAEQMATKATELNPKYGGAWNQLGYAKLAQKNFEEAVAAFKKYAEVSPKEPNAHDSLGDAQLASGQLDAALASYEKALDVSDGKFHTSYTGVATVRAIRNDFDGARAAITRQKDSMSVAADKLSTEIWMAWAHAAQGRLEEGLKSLTAMEREAAAMRLDGLAAKGVMERVLLQLAAGKYPEAQKELAALEKVKTDNFSEGMKKQHRLSVLIGQVAVNSRLGKTAEAEKALTSLDNLVKTEVTGPMANDSMVLSRGLVALGKRDFRTAADTLKGCTEMFDYCRLVMAEAQEKAGDTKGATATRTALLKTYHRDPQYLFIHSQVESMLKVPGKKVGLQP